MKIFKYILKEVKKNNKHERYASFPERLLAFILDSLLTPVLSIAFFFIITIINLILNFNNHEGNTIIKTIFPIFQILIPILLLTCGQPIYSLFADCSKKHRTFGKGTQKIYVINNKGEYLNFKESLLRTLIKSLTILIPFGLIISIIM